MNTACCTGECYRRCDFVLTSYVALSHTRQVRVQALAGLSRSAKVTRRISQSQSSIVIALQIALVLTTETEQASICPCYSVRIRQPTLLFEILPDRARTSTRPPESGVGPRQSNSIPTISEVLLWTCFTLTQQASCPTQQQHHLNQKRPSLSYQLPRARSSSECSGCVCLSTGEQAKYSPRAFSPPRT